MSVLEPAVWIGATRRHKRLTIAVAVGLSLPLMAWLWREGDLSDVSPTPFSRAASIYNVDGVYGLGGWLLPVALRTIAVHADYVSVWGPDGKLVVGAHAIQFDHGVVAQAGAVDPATVWATGRKCPGASGLGPRLHAGVRVPHQIGARQRPHSFYRG
jgi:hypothetical protein